MAGDPAANDNKYIVPALAQGLGILSLFGPQRRQVTAPEIAKQLSLPRTTVFRLLQTLQSMDYLRCDPDKRHFTLGPALLNRTILAVVVTVCLLTFNFAFVSWVPTFLVKQGLGVSNSLGLSMLMFAGGPLGSFIGLLLSERVGRRVYLKRGAYYFVDTANKWHPLGRTYPEALKRLAVLLQGSSPVESCEQLWAKYQVEVLTSKSMKTSPSYT